MGILQTDRPSQMNRNEQVYLPKLEPRGWRVARSAQDAVSRSHSSPIKPLSLRPLTSTRVSQVIYAATDCKPRSAAEAVGDTMPCKSCLRTIFARCRDELEAAIGACLSTAPAPTVSTQWLLCCCSSVCMSLHLLPVLPLTIPASNCRTLTHSLVFQS